MTSPLTHPVVNIAPTVGLLSPQELGAYAASKHAVVALSECLPSLRDLVEGEALIDPLKAAPAKKAQA